MNFPDYFSGHSAIYKRARPGYPAELIQYLIDLVPAQNKAWDVGTGNGQVAVLLSNFFSKVIATDASEQQISEAPKIENIHYRISLAENSGLENKSFDMITVATAIHWFDINKFYAEVERVLKPGGVLAVWSYAHVQISKDIDPIIEEFAFHFLEDFWPVETHLVWKDKYQTLPFPYKEINSPAFEISEYRTLEGFYDFIRSWSAYQRYIKKNNADPLNYLNNKLQDLWPDGEQKKKIRWPIYLKVGKKPL